VIYLFSILFALNTSSAATSCQSNSQGINNIKETCSNLSPVCIQEGDNFKGSAKTAVVIENLMKNVSDDELFTRLIFSESLASGCDLNNDIFESIAWTLKNRVARKDVYGKETDRSVVLKPSQFSSSTGPCDVAKRKEFLCPTQFKGFEEVWIKATKAWDNTKSAKNPIPTVRHYFFPHHFDNSKQSNCLKWKGVQPAWAKQAPAVKSIGTCATFHNVSE
jgi:hypothetical protein